MLARTALAAALAAALASCAPTQGNVDPTRAVERPEPGLPVLTFHWKFELADRQGDSKPQEFASAAVATGGHPDDDRVYAGSKDGWFYAFEPGGEVVWKAKLGATSSLPLVDGQRLYLGTDDGQLLAVNAATGEVLWRYASRAPVLEPPVIAGELILFANESDEVYALDRHDGTLRWKYEVETPEEFTLRGHAGVAVSGDLAFTGFADGTLVALRTATGSVAWLSSLQGKGERFIDVDATPIVIGKTVYAASSAGGVYALDTETGGVRWQLPAEGVGALATDGERLYAAAAETGIYALDLGGNILWRQGTRGGGEPAQPVVDGDYLIYALSEAGLFVADKRTGEVHQFFDPGYGISSTPTVARGRAYVVSNSAILYAMGLRTF